MTGSRMDSKRNVGRHALPQKPQGMGDEVVRDREFRVREDSWADCIHDIRRGLLSSAFLSRAVLWLRRWSGIAQLLQVLLPLFKRIALLVEIFVDVVRRLDSLARVV